MMRRKIAEASLAALVAGGAASCTMASNEHAIQKKVDAAASKIYLATSFVVGRSEWVHDLDVPPPNNECLIERNATITSDDGRTFIYHQQQPMGDHGTECADMLPIDITETQAETQDHAYVSFWLKKRQITEFLGNLSVPPDSIDTHPLADGSVNWATVVNPTPVAHSYPQQNVLSQYGDVCFESPIGGRVGHYATLPDGEKVDVYFNQFPALGSLCPTGTLFLPGRADLYDFKASS